MSKKKRKIINLFPSLCAPEECDECIYIGEGDFVCCKDNRNTTVLEDFIPTVDYMWCRRERENGNHHT